MVEALPSEEHVCVDACDIVSPKRRPLSGPGLLVSLLSALTLLSTAGHYVPFLGRWFEFVRVWFPWFLVVHFLFVLSIVLYPLGYIRRPRLIGHFCFLFLMGVQALTMITLGNFWSPTLVRSVEWEGETRLVSAQAISHCEVAPPLRKADVSIRIVPTACVGKVDAQDYPFRVSSRQRPHYASWTMVSSAPLTLHLDSVGESLPQVMLAKLESKGIHIVWFSAQEADTKLRDPIVVRLLLRRLSTQVRHLKTPALILGFGGLPAFGTVLEHFREVGRVRDLSHGQGVLFSRWWNPWFQGHLFGTDSLELQTLDYGPGGVSVHAILKVPGALHQESSSQ